MNYTSEAAFRFALRELLAGITGAQVIWFNANGNRPPKPYVTLFSSAPAEAVGEDETVGPPPYRQVGRRRTEFSLQAFGHEAASLLAELMARLHSWTDAEKFTAAGIAVVQVSAVRDLTTLVGSAYETRAQFDAVASWVFERAEDVPPIERVELNDVVIE